MVDFIEELYTSYCENHKDMFVSNVDNELKSIREKIDSVLPVDLVNKLYEMELADSERAFRCGFAVAMKLAMQGVSA